MPKSVTSSWLCFVRLFHTPSLSPTQTTYGLASDADFFFRPRRFILLFLPMRSLDLGYWDFDSLSFKIVQNFSVIISWQAALTANVHRICYKLSCMRGQTLCIYFPGKERGSKEVSVCFSIVVKIAFLPLYFWKETYTQLSVNRHLYKADNWCWFLPFSCYFSVSILSQDTHPFKTDNRHFWNRQRTLKKCSIEWKYLKNTSKQYTVNCLFYYFAD